VFWFPIGAIFSLVHRVQTGSGAHSLKLTNHHHPQADPPSKESFRPCNRSRNWKSGQGPKESCRAIDRCLYSSVSCSGVWLNYLSTGTFSLFCFTLQWSRIIFKMYLKETGYRRRVEWKLFWIVSNDWLFYISLQPWVPLLACLLIQLLWILFNGHQTLRAIFSLA
jgi:hypothetical protein